MDKRNKTRLALSYLLPAGVLGASTLLAGAQAKTPDALVPDGTRDTARSDVADRLAAVRESAAVAGLNATLDVSAGDKILLAEWINFGGGGGGLGWRNGGWGNGGWHNAPNWGNGGWHNAPNWGNGGWHNFWHNW